MNQSKRRIVIITLIILTLVLGIAAVAISYYIQQNQSPGESSADSTCPNGTTIYYLPGGAQQCKCDNNNNYLIPIGSPDARDCFPGNCPSGTVKAATGSDGYICRCLNNPFITMPLDSKDSSACYACPSGTHNGIFGAEEMCICDNDSNIAVIKGSTDISLCSAGSGGSGGSKTALTSCTSTCNDSDGCTCPSGCNSTSVANGATCGGAASGGGSCSGACFTPGSSYNGTTVQNCGSVGRVTVSGQCNPSSDLCCGFTSGGGGGSTPVDTRSQCGGACTTASDCQPAATSGVTIVCRNGKCENSACDPGKTVPGANCSCSNLNACGSQCSDVVGLCQSGSTCGFISTSASGTENSCNSVSLLRSQYQVCLPLSPQNGYTLTQCNDIATVYLKTSTGARATTTAQVLEACGQVTQTVTCYRCSTSTSDGNSCEAFTDSGTSCPTGTSTSSTGCAAAAGGSCSACGDGVCSTLESSSSCPVDCGSLPDTAIFNDRTDRIILGIIVILLGISLAGGFDKFRKASRA